MAASTSGSKPYIVKKNDPPSIDPAASASASATAAASKPSTAEFAFAKFFLSPFLSDVVLMCGSKKCPDFKIFPAHKIILAERSPVFRKMFEVDMKESNTNKVEVIASPEALEELLRFLYTGKFGWIAGPDLLIDIFELGHLYEMDKVKEACVAFLTNDKDNAIVAMSEFRVMGGVSLSTMIRIYDTGELYEEPALKEAFYKTIKKNKDILAEDVGTFKCFSANYPGLMRRIFLDDDDDDEDEDS